MTTLHLPPLTCHLVLDLLPPSRPPPGLCLGILFCPMLRHPVSPSVVTAAPYAHATTIPTPGQPPGLYLPFLCYCSHYYTTSAVHTVLLWFLHIYRQSTLLPGVAWNYSTWAEATVVRIAGTAPFRVTACHLELY